MLGGIDNLETDWDSTAELARHLRKQRELTGRPADTAAVIADLEAILHGSMPLLPDYKPKPATLDQLLPAIDNAQRRYDDLIRQHVTLGRNHAGPSSVMTRAFSGSRRRILVPRLHRSPALIGRRSGWRGRVR